MSLFEWSTIHPIWRMNLKKTNKILFVHLFLTVPKKGLVASQNSKNSTLEPVRTVQVLLYSVVEQKRMKNRKKMLAMWSVIQRSIRMEKKCLAILRYQIIYTKTRDSHNNHICINSSYANLASTFHFIIKFGRGKKTFVPSHIHLRLFLISSVSIICHHLDGNLHKKEQNK